MISIIFQPLPRLMIVIIMAVNEDDSGRPLSPIVYNVILVLWSPVFQKLLLEL